MNPVFLCVLELNIFKQCFNSFFFFKVSVVLMMGLCRMTLSLEMAAFTQDLDPSISRTLLQTGGLYIGGGGEGGLNKSC